MLGFQVYPTTEMPGNLKNTKIKDGEIKSLIKTERNHIAFAIFGISHDGDQDICT